MRFEAYCVIGSIIGCLGLIIAVMMFPGFTGNITLPKEAHNTVGDIPIVEMIDDGPNYVNQKEIKFCDEMWPSFSCHMRFGYSYAVSGRVASGEFLESCEEAKIDGDKELKFCLSQCGDIDALSESRHFYEGYNQHCQKMCNDQQLIIPECDGLPKGKSAKEKYNDLLKNVGN